MPQPTPEEIARATELRVTEIARIHTDHVHNRVAPLSQAQRAAVHRQLERIMLEIAREQTTLVPNKQQISEARRLLKCRRIASQLSD